MPRRIQVSALLASVLAAMLIAAVPARASDVLVPSAGDCAPRPASQPFRGWFDSSRYFLVDDGGFEHGATGWRLSGATVVDGNEPWHVGAPGAHALAIPTGASATSPPVCIDLGHPTMRFFARRTGSPLGLLGVQVVVRTSAGTLALPVGVVARITRRWAPSLPMLTLANLLTLADGSTAVWFRFTAIGPGSSWEIDDVYVDPYRKG